MFSEKTGETESRVFERLVDYPCEFQLKVIGRKEGEFEADMIKIISQVTGVEAEVIKFTSRDTPKYLSVSIQAPVANAEMLYECYDALGEDSRVKAAF